jgi:low temperature requirement protein LtrA
VTGASATVKVSGSLVSVAVAGFVVLFALWWLYFLEATGDVDGTRKMTRVGSL